ncbi:hypothetical protein [Streptomyces sp. NPDC046182]|uniref:hypothetical protein n=1 Tax=Streptomyces sp. NPDC046182 TaxID=3154601 RepID=UPI0033ECD543
MTALAVRPLLSIAAASLALGSVSLAGAPAAFAAPGDNGDIKIHHAGGRGEPRRTPANDETTQPRVCTFYLAAFDFEGVQQLSWTVSPQRPVDSVTTNGTITIDSTGRGITPDLTLVDGAYRVEWTWEGQTSARKSRDFRVDCDDLTNASANGNNGSNGSSANGSGANANNANTGSASATNGNGNGGSGNAGNGNGSGTGNSWSGSSTSNGNGGSGNAGNGNGSGTGNSWSGSSTSSGNGSTGNGSGGTGSTWSGSGGGGGGSESASSGWNASNGRPPQGPVGAGGGGSATTTSESSDDGSVFGIASALAAGLAGTAGLILVRRARRRTHGAS